MLALATAHYSFSPSKAPSGDGAATQDVHKRTAEKSEKTMRLGKFSSLRISLATLILGGSCFAQMIRFEDFSTLNNLSINGPAHKATYNSQNVLRLTDGFRNAVKSKASTVWFNVKQPLNSGFTSYFAFQVHNPAACCNPGDGLAFVIQNASSTDATYGATGAGLTALGVPNGGIGYAGILNSLAIELDTTMDAWDPTSNHVAVQSCGTKTNGPVHIPGEFTIGQNHHVTSCLLDPNGIDSGNDLPHLGVTCGPLLCQDGVPHQVVVEYTGNAKNNPHNLKVYVDPPFIPGTHTPANNAVPQINISLTIETLLSLDNNSAWVGFTASQASQSQSQDLIAWEFTPHQDVQIQEQINNDGTQNTFVYGGHLYGVTYPPGGNPDGDFMTVKAILIDKLTFYQTRLLGTKFANEQCLTYLETGGNCVVYEVTCQKNDKVTPVDCPNPPNDQLINTLTTYTTNDPVNAQNADYLKAPIGTNDWISIFTGFSENPIDPTTSGAGKDFSDFVATFKPHGPQQGPNSR